MTSLPEQFTAARKAQFEAGFDIFQSFANQAFEGASRVAALNLSTSRESLELSARTVRTLLASRDPRDLLMLGGHAEEQVRTLFNYSRELMDIAGGIRPYAPRSLAQAAGANVETVSFKPVVPAPVAPFEAAPAPQPVDEPAKAAAPADAAEPLVVVEAEAPAEPAVELIVAAETPPDAEPTVIASAASNGTPHAGVPAQPAAAPVDLAEPTIPKLDIVRSTTRRKK